MPVWKGNNHTLKENRCCTLQSKRAAREICQKLRVPFFVEDARKKFQEKVVNYFISELKKLRTPNPCIICNRYLKFQELFNFAKARHIHYVATGHYARVNENNRSGKFELLRPRDKIKDQTYALYLLPQKWLRHLVFPLGEYKKSEVYQIAKERGFDFFSKTKQSQDFCFVSGNDLEIFLRKKFGSKKGKIVDSQGKVLGQHQGLHLYTIGQRKRIGLAGGPYFVEGFDLKKNILKVTRKESELGKRNIILSPFHFIAGVFLKKETEVLAKIRYRHPLQKATLFPPQRSRLRIIFKNPQRAVTPGQFCVFYKNEICLGGGMIVNGSITSKIFHDK